MIRLTGAFVPWLAVEELGGTLAPNLNEGRTGRPTQSKGL